jgi:hypothetical protein
VERREQPASHDLSQYNEQIDASSEAKREDLAARCRLGRDKAGAGATRTHQGGLFPARPGQDHALHNAQRCESVVVVLVTTSAVNIAWLRSRWWCWSWQRTSRRKLSAGVVRRCTLTLLRALAT